MSHTIREKKKLLARVRRIRGQVEAIERALDGEADRPAHRAARLAPGAARGRSRLRTNPRVCA